MHDVDSTRQSVDLASFRNLDDQQASLGSFVHGAQEGDGGIKRGSHDFNHMKVINPWETKNWILLVILIFYYWLVWKKASVFYVSIKRTCRISLSARNTGFQQDCSFISRARRAQTPDQFISGYAFIEFPVRICHDTCSFQSVDHFSGSYVVTKGSLLRRRSQSTCLDVEFQSWS